MAVRPGPDGCVQYLVSRAEMISAHSHSGSVRAGGAARAAGHHGHFTRHTATLTGDPPRDLGRNDAHLTVGVAAT